MRLAAFRKHPYLLWCIIFMSLSCTLFYLFRIKYIVIREVTQEPFTSNLSCPSVDGDILPSTDKLKFSYEDKLIFFHVTSCRGINSRQACSIESAARLHPKWYINVLFSAPLSEGMLRGSHLALLLKYPNIKYSRVLVSQYCKGTLLEETLTQKLIKSAHQIEHASDLLRILTLNKYGGVYLDTDSLLIKSLDSLPSNWIAKQSYSEIASGAMGFSKTGVGAIVTLEIMREQQNSFQPSSWAHNGPLAIQRVLVRLCPDVLKTTTVVPSACEGIHIFPSQEFYPVHYSNFKKYFITGTIDKLEEPYMHHMWNYMSKNTNIEKDSPYAYLAKKYCPTVYETYIEDFGINR